jgi:melanoma-associated antigen p97
MEAGDIAFLTHTTVEEMVASKSFKGLEIEQFQLLCKNGQRMPLSEYRQCNWGRVPSHAVVTSSARLADERRQYQRFLQKAVERYSRKSIGTYSNGTYQDDGRQNKNRNDDSGYYNPNERFNPTTDRYNRNNRYDSGRNYEERNDNRNDRNNYFDQNNTMDADGKPYEKFEMFESARYGRRLNLMFQDAARTLVPIKEENQNFAFYLGDALEIILDVRHCPVGRMTLCVTSDPEMDKCVKMRVSTFCIIS